MTTDRHLLFGLLALQNGLIDQGQLVAAFHGLDLRQVANPWPTIWSAWGTSMPPSGPPSRPSAAVHVEAYGGDVGQEPGRRARGKLHPQQPGAALATPRSRRHSDASVRHIGRDRWIKMTPTAPPAISVGSATSDGQRFRMLRPHARGGLGAVFVALDGELHREVALKQILEKHADDPVSRAAVRRRGRDHRRAGAPGRRPGLRPGHGYADGRPYYAMRFIKGDSLKEAIAQFHDDETLKARPRPSVAGAAQAAASLHRRLQRRSTTPTRAG